MRPILPLPALDRPDLLAAALGGFRTGLLAGPAAVSIDGATAAEVLAAAGAELRLLFAAEHGLAGKAAGETFGDARDPMTGLPVLSLYGPRWAPEPAQLAGLDALVVDLPTVGVRCYTFLGTAIGAMTAAARAGVETVVLDRPNPLGRRVEGGHRVDRIRRLLCPAALPHRFGLSLGEALTWVAAERGLPPPRVVPVAGWSGEAAAPGTGWRAPSPGLPALDSALAYPATVFLEATALSEGRGTPRPFAWFGAPWLDAEGLAARIEETAGGTVEAGPEPATPSEGAQAGESCRGVHLAVVDPDRFQATDLALTVLAWIRDRHPGRLCPTPLMDALAGGPELRRWCEAPGAEAAPLLARWRRDAAEWLRFSEDRRLYPPAAA